MATFDEFYRSLPEDSNKRGEYFEKYFIPWFLRTDPEWSTKVRQIWLWEEYPQRWGKDCGIDLVYEDHQGKHWAVQSKCISPDREISKAEIDSFLSESNDSRIHGRLLIASTDGIGKNALQVIERQERQVICFLREHFCQSEVEFPTSPEDLSTGRRKDKRRPRRHQQEAIQNVVEGLQTADRGQLLMACGTGKTLTSLWIKEALDAKRTLVLLPSLSLLSQTLREWTGASQKEFNWICVCSDQSVAKKDKTIDNWIEHVSELGVPVTNDPTEIRGFLLNNEEGVVFSTYQSSPLVAEAQKSTDIPAFNIAFADEAHRCVGNASAAFGVVLDSQKIRAEKRLFMTATPRVLSSRIKGKAETEDIEVASMDDEDKFGRVLHKLNFSEAIKRDLLTDYRVVIIGVDDPEVQSQIINRPLSSTGTGVTTDFETLANHISLAKSIRNYDLQRVITFHGRVKRAQSFSEDHPRILEWLPPSSKSEKSVRTSYVSGEMTSLERNIRISALRNLRNEETGILSNARCLSEGVDIPSLDGIAFIDPRSSQVDIIQAVGRAIRKSEAKSFGYIIIPVYLGDVETAEDEILASRFKDVWEIILALKSQDDTLGEVLDRLRVELGQHKQTKEKDGYLAKIIFDLPQIVTKKIGDSLQTLIVKHTSDCWLEKYGELKEYIASSDGKLPRQTHPNLGWWTTVQRREKRRGRILPSRKEMLEALDAWSWDTDDDKWMEKYYLLQEYVKTNGHSRPPRSEPRIGAWVNAQRLRYKDLPENRFRLLDKLQESGWTWSLNETTWNEKYEELKEYYNDNDGLNPSTTTPLGQWVRVQRSNYKKSVLKQSRIELLELLKGWCWDENEARWHERYNQLRIYFEREGHSRPSKMTDKVLGTWANSQVVANNRGKLSKERYLLLEEIKFWNIQ